MKILQFFTVILLLLNATISCSSEDAIGESEIDTSTPELTQLDTWIRDNIQIPYNIEVTYRFKRGELDNDRYLYPPDIAKIQPLMEQVLSIWIDTYNQEGGEEFIKKVAPRQIVLSGGKNINTNNTRTLGVADSGAKITLFEVDELDLTNKDIIRSYFSTIQHEYGHILNQIKPFSPNYSQITPGDYDSGWANTSTANAKELGFISSYSRSAPAEDFVEIVAHLLTYSKAEYDAIIDAITSDNAKEKLRIKEALVAQYYKDSWGLDIYKLQKITTEKFNKLVGDK